ncbi:MAG: TetR/AcrR family transcriptional regulator [Burkholderiaceae bacterium]|nr:TetR/AcrR family transcriptional regulator [Burkholderiaceae bacterium]
MSTVRRRQAPQSRAAAEPRIAAALPDAPQGTRERILQAALALIRQRGNANFSLVELAAETGLSRQTLYLLFGTRAGLLMALVDDIDARSSGPAQLAALRQQGERDFEPYVRAWLEYLPVVLPVARALSAAAASGDADARAAWESRLAKLRHGFTQMARGLQADGRLRAGWTVAQAAEWILALTHIDLWQHLVVEAGWKPADHVERIVDTLRKTLVKG